MRSQKVHLQKSGSKVTAACAARRGGVYGCRQPLLLTGDRGNVTCKACIKKMGAGKTLAELVSLARALGADKIRISRPLHDAAVAELRPLFSAHEKLPGWPCGAFGMAIEVIGG